MKNTTFLMTLAISATLMIVASGCKHTGVGEKGILGTTRIGGTPDKTNVVTMPGSTRETTRPGRGTENLPQINPPETKTTTVEVAPVPVPTPPSPAFDDTNVWTEKWNLPLTADTNIFSAYTVYFELDSSVIRAGEQAKLEHIADFFKNNTNDLLMIEGHCDERGTEQYNLALGDRRALAVRDYLSSLGVHPGRIHTISYGEDRPVDRGHNEAAWSKNRRGVSILMRPEAAK